jgi:hypothetical protein
VLSYVRIRSAPAGGLAQLRYRHARPVEIRVLVCSRTGGTVYPTPERIGANASHASLSRWPNDQAEPGRQSLSGHQARDGYRRAGRGGNPSAGCARRRASIQRSNVFACDADFAQSSDRMLPQRCQALARSLLFLSHRPAVSRLGLRDVWLRHPQQHELPSDDAICREISSARDPTHRTSLQGTERLRSLDDYSDAAFAH